MNHDLSSFPKEEWATGKGCNICNCFLGTEQNALTKTNPDKDFRIFVIQMRLHLCYGCAIYVLEEAAPIRKGTLRKAYDYAIENFYLGGEVWHFNPKNKI